MMHLVGTLAAGETPEPDPGTPPAGAPTNASAYSYGGGLVGVQWVSGDPEAFTVAGRSESAVTPPSSGPYAAPPGATNLETGEATTEHWWVRHLKDSQYSDWVYAPFGF